MTILLRVSANFVIILDKDKCLEDNELQNLLDTSRRAVYDAVLKIRLGNWHNVCLKTYAQKIVKLKEAKS